MDRPPGLIIEEQEACLGLGSFLAGTQVLHMVADIAVPSAGVGCGHLDSCHVHPPLSILWCIADTLVSVDSDIT